MLEPRFVQPPLFNVAPSPAEPSPTLNKLSPENNLSSSSEASDGADLSQVQANSVDDQGDRPADESAQPHSVRSWEPSHLSSLEPDSDQVAMPNPPDDRLDDSSLNTVLDMLAVINTVEELALLELLTNAQKRQVWEVTPEEVKTKLRQLRLSAKHAPAPSVTSSEPEPFRSQQSSAEPDLEDSEEPDLRELEELTYSEEWHEDEAIEPDFNPVEMAASNHQLTLTVGDWVVLQANSRLTAAELEAIWEVVEVHPHQNIARIQTKGVGTRNYPIAWMVLYPKPGFD